MKSTFTLLAYFLILALFGQGRYTIVVHGGAGNGLSASNLSTERQTAYHKGINKALLAGASVLDSGGTALQTVAVVLSQLENDSNFNAGQGAVLTYKGQASLDASIMDGRNLNAGAVSGLSRTKNPIQAALAVLQYSPHVLLSGSGADEFADAQNLSQVSPNYFITKSKVRALKRFKASLGSVPVLRESDAKMGTVGCAVLDAQGNLAAGTSTGGMTGKRNGRIGDSPIIGAGTYANNETCAISCTGHGEYFIRYAVAYDVHARMAYNNQDGPAAAEKIIQQVLKPAGGQGGLIGLTSTGQIIMEFNTKGMIRGYLKQNKKPVTSIF